MVEDVLLLLVSTVLVILVLYEERVAHSPPLPRFKAYSFDRDWCWLFLHRDVEVHRLCLCLCLCFCLGLVGFLPFMVAFGE